MKKANNKEINNKEMEITEHLSELRFKIIIVAVSLILSTSIIYIYTPEFINLFLNYLDLELLRLNFINLTEAFFTRFKLAVILAIIIISPLIIYQSVTFIGPGLKTNEKKIIYPLVSVTLILFFLGFIFGLFIMVPFIIKYLYLFGIDYLEPFLLGGKFLSFILSICIASGFIFFIPLVVYILSKFGFVDYSFYSKFRKYLIICIVLFEGLINPSFDLIMYLIVGLPIILLYEVSIIIIKIKEKMN
ncbi:MAG: twin-arginine translocase subunit TatC [Clostridiales bacterium]